jgi:hypothetical protein
MQARLGVLIAVLAAGSGCTTGTAHRLPLAGNPLRAQASACEAACRRQLRSAGAPCRDTIACEEDRPAAPPDESSYARCLDSCPGATAIDGASCQVPPEEGVICVETSRANPGGIAGGTVAVASGVTVVLVIAAIASLPLWVLVIAIAVH